MNETIKTITNHVSVRRFKATPLSDDLLEMLKEAMRRGPSSSALQTYTIVLIQSPETKKTLQKYAGQQAFIMECPLVIVACADLRRVQNITLTRDYPYRASDLRTFITSIEDLTIALQNASLAAQSLGLGTVMLGGVLNGSREIAALLTLPQRVVPILGLCMGYPAEDQVDMELRPRLPRQVVFHEERFSLTDSGEQELLTQHDAEVVARRYYEGRRIPITAVSRVQTKDNVPDTAYGWTEHVARKQSRLWWEDASSKLYDDLWALGVDITG